MPDYIEALEAVERAARRFLHARNARESGDAMTELSAALDRLEAVRVLTQPR